MSRNIGMGEYSSVWTALPTAESFKRNHPLTFIKTMEGQIARISSRDLAPMLSLIFTKN